MPPEASPEASPAVQACALPPAIGLDPAWVAAAYFKDAYRVPLAPGAGPMQMPVLFAAVFGHSPAVIKAALLARNRVARAFGLAVPAADTLLHPVWRTSYKVGDTIGPWPIFAISEHELIAGRDNPHLDFRLSLLREPAQPGALREHLVVSTVCSVHNRFGKLYLWVINPFHRWGVKLLLRRALAAGRL